jgi:murein DD-endopeptidase MepM/ murein hydrolase activator NlpD/LysM repeat protein
LKKLRYIAVLPLTLLGFWGNATTLAGDPPGTTAATSDTSQTYTSELLAADTSQPNAIAGLDTSIDITDPPVNPPATAISPLENSEDQAGEIYEDFDTTVVHVEKFDALTFDDTVAINMNGYVHPFNGNITSGFGFRKYRYHLGMDIDLEIGDSVKCAFDGKVRIAQKSKTYGYVVVVRHPNGLETYYAHLSKLLVRPGQELHAGEILGLGGNTGHSFGSHLHFEVRYGGQPIDPNYLIDFKKECVRADTYYLSKSDFKYLAEVHKVSHYSKKKKKGYVTYYNAGGPHYATPEARAIMSKVSDPIMPGENGEHPVMTTKNTAPKDSIQTSTPPIKNTATQKTPPKKTAATPVKTQNAAAKTPAKTTPVKDAPGTPVYYVVKSGDSLYKIALHYNTTVDKLCALNRMKSTAILNVGKKLRVK